MLATRRDGLLAGSLALFLLAASPVAAFGNNVLSTDGYSTCPSDGLVQVNDINIRFNKVTKVLKFDVSGESKARQNVTAHLTVTAYGNPIYDKSFNPCHKGTYVDQLCPVPAGRFSAHDTQQVPEQYADLNPSIAFTFPDLDGQGILTLRSLDSKKTIACIQSHIGNGMTAKVPAVSYAAAGISGAALIMSGLSSLSTFSNPGTTGYSPSFFQTITWFQSIAMNGMLSVQYPGVYHSFTQNFAFTTGLLPWNQLQTTIDNFRKQTGGNLTHNNVEYLRRISYHGSSGSPISKRDLQASGSGNHVSVHGGTGNDQPTANSNNSGNNSGSNGDNGGSQDLQSLNGLKGYAEQLLVPQSNVFMTVLLVFAVVIAAITAAILLFKVILEAWALFGNFPKGLVGFRKRYWLLLGKTITNLIMALYSVWTLYCIYQFTIGDSWAAKLLAGVTLGIFTAILAFFTIKIWLRVRKAKKLEGDTSLLYEDKETWVKYSLFYDNYKRSCWWLFIPVIIYMFAKGCVIAGGNGNGLVQCGGQLIVDAFLLALLLWTRPYSFNSGNWINIVIQVVRVLSVVCILVFVEELGISQTTKTVTGLALIIVQAVLTGMLAILIAVNWLIQVCKKNPHRKARKEAEKSRNDEDELTPLDAHNSMLLYPIDQKHPKLPDVQSLHSRGRSQSGYDELSTRDDTPNGYREQSRAPLARNGQRMGSRDDTLRSVSPEPGYLNREPQLPDLGYTGRGIAL